MGSAIMGEWECKAPNWWTYYRLGRPRPYGNVVCHREDGPADAAWDALVTAGPSEEATGDEGDETTIVAGVSLNEARAAMEHHAARQDGDETGERSEA